MSCDADRIYFYVRTAVPLTAPADHWMQLCLDIDASAKTGWLGYDFIVNRRAPNGMTTTLERLNADGTPTAGQDDIPVRWARGPSTKTAKFRGFFGRISKR